MKAFILCDYEGTTGTVTWEDEDSLGPEAMAGDVNATIKGLRAGGFTKFVVRDYHGNGKTIHPADIDPEATLIRGKSTPFPYGLQPDFDAMCFIGAHTKACTQTGVMSHTMTGSIHNLTINGVSIGEIGGYALLSGHIGVPIIFVSGDQAACDEAEAIIGDVETAATKIGFTRFCAECLHPKVSRERIESKAFAAAKRVKEFKPLKWDGPFTMEVTYRSPELADRGCETIQGERIDGVTVRLVRDTVYDVLRCFERGFE